MSRRFSLRRLALALLAGALAAIVMQRARRRPSGPSQGATIGYLAPWYDRFVALAGAGHAFRSHTIRRANIRPGDHVLDVGCGTGMLTRFEQERVGPAGFVVGSDVDPAMIATAKRNASLSGQMLDFVVASAAELPFVDGALDLVTASLMVHHLDTRQKALAFGEIYRVLRPGGRFILVDAGPATGPLASLVRRLHPLLSPLPEIGRALDNLEGRLPAMLEAAGFVALLPLETRSFLGLSLVFLQAERPAERTATR